MSQYTGLEKKRILVVEDVELNQYLARHIMESWGCVVDIAENGAEALEHMEQEDYDIVLMDIQMPVMDGMEATAQIRALANREKAEIPIVALTANAVRGEYDVYLRAGMNDCLPKPFEEAELFKIVLKNIRKDSRSNMYENGIAEQENQELQVAEPEAELYDLSMVEAISGGDRSFIIKMLQLFLSTVPPTLKDIRTATDKKEWLALSKLAHKLKSTIDSMGIAGIKQDIRFIETAGKTGENVEAVPARVDKVLSVMQEVLERVKKDHGL